MRIVMPLFSFEYEDSEEFIFSGGKYSLRPFNSDNEIPQIDLFSEQDKQHMQMKSWALVADEPDIDKYKQEVNILLLSFKIYKLARLFIKYRLCKDDVMLCRRINQNMEYVLAEKSPILITFDDLKVIDKGFSNLLKMKDISNRTYNAIYFFYRGYHSAKWIDAFIFWMSALESLFSKDEPGAATKTICSRVSALLDSKPRCEYDNIKKLYDLRSEMVHGRIGANLDDVPEQDREKLEILHELEYVATECMKKILDDKIYLIYSNDKQKERYFN
jgi:hypothetical protein